MVKATTDIKNQQLLSAFLDGELEVADRAAAEALLDNPRYAKLVESWKQNGTSMRALPKSELDAGLAERVLQKIDQSARGDQPIVSVDSHASGVPFSPPTCQPGD